MSSHGSSHFNHAPLPQRALLSNLDTFSTYPSVLLLLSSLSCCCPVGFSSLRRPPVLIQHLYLRRRLTVTRARRALKRKLEKRGAEPSPPPQRRSHLPTKRSRLWNKQICHPVKTRPKVSAVWLVCIFSPRMFINWVIFFLFPIHSGALQRNGEVVREGKCRFFSGKIWRQGKQARYMNLWINQGRIVLYLCFFQPTLTITYSRLQMRWRVTMHWRVVWTVTKTRWTRWTTAGRRTRMDSKQSSCLISPTEVSQVRTKPPQKTSTDQRLDNWGVAVETAATQNSAVFKCKKYCNFLLCLISKLNLSAHLPQNRLCTMYYVYRLCRLCLQTVITDSRLPQPSRSLLAKLVCELTSATTSLQLLRPANVSHS